MSRYDSLRVAVEVAVGDSRRSKGGNLFWYKAGS